jgi:hypothetical protein
MADWPTQAQFSADDKQLLARAAAWDQCQQLSDCSPPALSKLAQQHGMEFATAVLYDRVLRHPHHRALFDRILSPY